MDIKTTPFHGPFGEYELAVNLLCREDGYWQSYAFLTVNLPVEPLQPIEAFIKCSDENEGLLELVLDNKLGKVLPGQEGRSGFCAYPKIAFDMAKLREFDPEGTEKYLCQAQQHQQKNMPPNSNVIKLS